MPEVVTAVQGNFLNLAELILASRKQIGSQEAYVDIATGRRITFAQWVDEAERVATGLQLRGVKPGDVIAVAYPPSIDYAIAVAAIALTGAVVTGINSRLGAREIAAIIEKCEPKFVIGGKVELSVTLDELNDSVHTYEPPSDIKPSDPAVIIWTSGTTGLPKGAWFDHRNMAAAVQTAGVMTHANDRRLFGMPMAHAGYMAKIWEQFAMGVALVLTPVPWDAQTMLNVLTTERINAGGGVPTQWAKLLEVPGISEADFSSLRVCLAATAPAAPELVERMNQVLGCPVVVRYAMTESPSITGTDPEDSPDVQYRTVGKPQSGISVEIVDDGGTVLAQGEVGRIRIAGPCVMRGYWNSPEETNAVLDSRGRLTSTDLGWLDHDGNLVISGRKSDMYIRGGYNVYPLEVENLLVEHPSILSAAVIGVARPVIGEIGVACISIVPGQPSPTREELRDWVKSQLADYKAPDEVLVVDPLPLTSVGKIDKISLKETVLTLLG